MTSPRKLGDLLRELGLSEDMLAALEASPELNGFVDGRTTEIVELERSAIADSADFHLTLREPPVIA